MYEKYILFCINGKVFSHNTKNTPLRIFFVLVLKEEIMKIDMHTKRGKFYRNFLYISLSLSVLTFMGTWIWEVWNKVPSNIFVRAGEEQGLEFYIPATATIYKNQEQGQVNVDLNKELTFYGETQDTYTMKIDLFGFIPFKKSEVSVIEERTLTPIGYPVGIYVQTDGILVIDTGSFMSVQGKKVSPAHKVLKSGDYIYKVNQEEVNRKEKLIKKIEECNGETMILGVRREEQYLNIEVKPVQDQKGEYKLGIWVRDNAQGIGTLTYMDENGGFGALGHGINDMDTTVLMEMKEGGLYKTDIISITKGTKGNPGELTGVIAYSDKYKLGQIYQNTSKGVYGMLERENIELNESPVPIALKQEIRKGKAQILCTISTEPELFEVEITDIHQENDNINRGLEIKVVDERLLGLTGGIVQGMSGSPIIQGGKIIGAVTHVLVNDPTKGYGIFIENMLKSDK